MKKKELEGCMNKVLWEAYQKEAVKMYFPSDSISNEEFMLELTTKITSAYQEHKKGRSPLYYSVLEYAQAYSSVHYVDMDAVSQDYTHTPEGAAVLLVDIVFYALGYMKKQLCSPILAKIEAGVPYDGASFYYFLMSLCGELQEDYIQNTQWMVSVIVEYFERKGWDFVATMDLKIGSDQYVREESK